MCTKHGHSIRVTPSGSRKKEAFVDRDGRSQRIAEYVAEKIRGGAGPGILFVRRRARAVWLAEQLSHLLGDQIPYITGEVPEARRAELAELLRTGQLPLAVATTIWTTGVDIPGLRWVGLCEGQAPIGVVQAAGRAARMADGKATFEVWNFDGRGAARREARLAEEGLEVDEVSEVSAPEAPKAATAEWRPWMSWILYGGLLTCLLSALTKHCGG